MDELDIHDTLDMGRTNSQVSHRYDELIAKQAAKTKEQVSTANEECLSIAIYRTVGYQTTHGHY